MTGESYLARLNSVFISEWANLPGGPGIGGTASPTVPRMADGNGPQQRAQVRTAFDVLQLVQAKIITTREARGFLFGTPSDPDFDVDALTKEELVAEVKRLRRSSGL